MLEWHDCKIDPPKKEKKYIVIYKIRDSLFWEAGEWNNYHNCFRVFDQKAHWEEGEYVDFEDYYGTPYKWAEIDLSEVK